jgi:hypothetical protein
MLATCEEPHTALLDVHRSSLPSPAVRRATVNLSMRVMLA